MRTTFLIQGRLLIFSDLSLSVGVAFSIYVWVKGTNVLMTDVSYLFLCLSSLSTEEVKLITLCKFLQQSASHLMSLGNGECSYSRLLLKVESKKTDKMN